MVGDGRKSQKGRTQATQGIIYNIELLVSHFGGVQYTPQLILYFSVEAVTYGDHTSETAPDHIGHELILLVLCMTRACKCTN